MIVVAGPTATGKTRLSLEIAKHFRCHIISADARQFYREMNIGTAKPDIDQLSQVPHHFINHLSIHDDYSAGQYEKEAIEFLPALFLQQPVQVMVGGSGLFIKSVLEGFDSFPPADRQVFEDLKKKFSEEGIESLQKLLKQHDPDYYEKVDLNNPQRLIRALTVSISSGKSYSSFRNQETKARDFIPIKIGLQSDKKMLEERISKRVDGMMQDGLMQEAEKLFPHRHVNALQTVGYAEPFEFFEKKISFEKIAGLIKQHTAQYAKRQMTWFRKEKEMRWFTPEQNEEIIQFLDSKIS